MSDEHEPAEGDAPARDSSADAAAFSREAEEAQRGLARELWDFLIHNKRWWLVPIVVVLLLLILLAVFASSPAAPFIYGV